MVNFRQYKETLLESEEDEKGAVDPKFVTMGQEYRKEKEKTEKELKQLSDSTKSEIKGALTDGKLAGTSWAKRHLKAKPEEDNYKKALARFSEDPTDSNADKLSQEGIKFFTNKIQETKEKRVEAQTSSTDNHHNQENEKELLQAYRAKNKKGAK